jgi:hypothetical protein
LATEQGEKILLESIKQNRGPSKLEDCRFDTRRLANAMRGNNRVKYLALPDDESLSYKAKVEFFQALAENEGITHLILSIITRTDEIPLTDEIWTTLWQSISRHPKLERIDFPGLQYRFTGWHDAQKTLRSQAIVDALRINTVLRDIDMNWDKYVDKLLFDDDIKPRLLANKYRPRVAAIAKEKGEWSRKLLRRALTSVASNPSLIWMFVSGNVNGLFPPTTRKRKKVPSSDAN